MSTEIANRLSEAGYFFETTLQKQLEARYGKQNINYAEFFSSMTPEEEKAAFSQYVTEMTAKSKKLSADVMARFKVPYDHDGFRAYLDRLRENARRYNKEVEPIFHVPAGNEIMKPIPEEERRRRHKLREDWGEKVMEEIICLRAQIDASTIMTRGSISREVQAFLVGGTFEEMEARGYIMCHGTAEEKRNLFTTRMTEVLDFMDSMQTYKSDEEFMRATVGKRWILSFFSEMDKTGDRLTEPFGFDEEHPLDPALKERWENWKHLGVTLGNLANRQDKLVSPYHELIDAENLTEEWAQFLDEVSDPDVAAEVGYEESPVIVNRTGFRALMEDEKKTINPLSPYQHSVGLEQTETFCRASLYDGLQYQIATRLEFPEEGTRYYTKDGRLLENKDAVSAELYKGGTVTVVNGVSAADFTAAAKGGSQLATPGQMTFNPYMSGEDLARAGQTVKERDPRLLNAFALRASAYASHGPLWRLFHGAEKDTVDRMRALAAQKGFSQAEILLAEKGDRLTAADLASAVTSLADAARATDDPEKIAAIREAFERLRDVSEQDKFAENEKLETAMQAASSAIDPPVWEEIAEGEPIEELEKDVAEPEKEPGMAEKDPPETEPQKIP